MSKFKVGDKVINDIDGPSIHYTVGDVDNRGYIKITHEGLTHSYNSHYFELVEESEPIVFKLGSLYYRPDDIEYHYKCCGFTSIGLPLFENPNGYPVAVGDGVRPKLIEYVKPIVVGSRIEFFGSELVVTAIHGDYAWVHKDNGTNYHGGPGGLIQRLDKLKAI